MDIKKAKGTSDTTQSDHIERKIIPKNADPTRTHLNRVLVEYPDGVHGRDEAIAHRLNTAGIRRKITHDQVRVVRVVLSGTHEDMMNIQEKGKLDEWCNDSIQWLQATFGKDNVVAAHLHMDEKTPHIHAAVVPIVTGERRKAKKEQTDGKRKYRKKTNSVRLCADDLFNRQTLVASSMCRCAATTLSLPNVACSHWMLSLHHSSSSPFSCMFIMSSCVPDKTTRTTRTWSCVIFRLMPAVFSLWAIASSLP